MKKPGKDLVEAFFEWFRTNSAIKHEDWYSKTITNKYLSGLSREEFIEFFFQFASDGGKIQSLGYRTAPMVKETIVSKYDVFRQFIMEPFESGFDELKWLEKKAEFKGLGQGLATIYLNRVDKKRFAIVNNKAVEAIQLLDVDILGDIVKKYQAIRNAERQLIDWYPEFDNFFRTDALAQFLIGEEKGKRWADLLRKEKLDSQGGDKNYWIFAPGEQARLWEQYYKEGVIGVGWDTLNQDLSSFKDWKALRNYYDKIYGEKANDIDFSQIRDFVLRIREGDRVFVKRGTSEIVGYGEVTSGYFYDAKRSEYRHLRKANWLKKENWKVPENIKMMPVKTLTEVKDPNRLRELLLLVEEPPPGGTDDGKPFFTKETFKLLKGLQEQPVANYYNENIADFNKEIEEPIQRIMNIVAGKLPVIILDKLETKKRIFSRILKNDYGRGGAWAHYWGAFYPKGGKRIEGPQLYVSISAKGLRFGFSIGDYGDESSDRFINNCVQHQAVLKRLLNPILAESDFIFGDSEELDEHTSAQIMDEHLSFEEWISDLEKYGIRVMLEIPADNLVKISNNELTGKILRTFKNLYPLMILSQQDEPVEAVQYYLNIGNTDPEDPNPDYSLDQFAVDANLEKAEIERWVRAIQSKKQVIFYGPPGTGKTFVARLLAQHLTGKGYGFIEIIQFHPSYAYEDFIQGLRPKALKAGGLEYSMIPGRFKDFCSHASECNDLCVLILDEINRANLSRVFGELMYLLEYRDESIPLAGGDRFCIPKNVRIIGTMNTADRSIALVDHALRRRFAFLGLYPNYDILMKYHEKTGFNPAGLIQVIQRINSTINDKHYSVGISFFLDPDIKSTIQDVWQMEIEPYIEEFFFDQQGKAETFTWDKVGKEILGE